MSTADGFSDRLAGSRLALDAAAAAATAWQDGGINEGKFAEQEIEEAFWDYVRRANANDWDRWVDIFTEDVLYIDHAWGVRRGREEVRKWMVPLMSQQPEMKFPVGFHVIRGDVVVNYNWNRWPNPDGSAEPYDEVPASRHRLDSWAYQFPCITIDRYAGDGLFSHEENFYSTPAFIGVLQGWEDEWLATGHQLGKDATS